MQKNGPVWCGLGAVVLGLGAVGPAAGQFLGIDRWRTTATDGFNPNLGDPTTLTWSFVPDGTVVPTLPGTSNSDLIVFFDGLYGDGGGGTDLTQRPWFFLYEDTFDRVGALSGLNFVYEPNDDGAEIGFPPGQLGVRGDIRMGGASIDGQTGSNTLAFNFFPDTGDGVIDTDNTISFGPSSNNSRRARNVIAHELAHGLGLDHVESSDARFLLEPFISTLFDGPQYHDILSLHRGYGDVFEKSNNSLGNNVAGNATGLGTLALGSAIQIGTDANDSSVAPTDTDFVSIDDNGDIDFFSFTLDGPALIDLTLTPQGPTFNIGLEGDPVDEQELFDGSAQSDLVLSLFDADGSSVLASSDTTGLGGFEKIDQFQIDAAGTYYARVTGKQNTAQLFQLDLLAMGLPSPDLNGDGFVGVADLDILLANWGNAAGTPALGDADGDGLVGQSDLDLVLAHFGTGPLPTENIPEPTSLALLLLGLGLTRRRRA